MTENKKISIKAVVLGCLTDLTGSLALGIVYAVILGIGVAVKGLPPKEFAALLQGPLVLGSGLIIGLGFTFLGGFVAGLVAQRSEVLHGGIVGAVGLVFTLVLLDSSYPLWFNILGAAGVVPAGLAGGDLAKLRHEKQNNSLPSAEEQST